MESRTLTAVLEAKLKGTPKSILLIGPRQTGKSTLLKGLGVSMEINLANEATYRAHLKDPHLLEAQVLGLKSYRKGVRILVDEVQRIPSLLNTIQAIVDSHPKVRFLHGNAAQATAIPMQKPTPSVAASRARGPVKGTLIPRKPWDQATTAFRAMTVMQRLPYSGAWRRVSLGQLLGSESP
jgi:hypothetical protein